MYQKVKHFVFTLIYILLWGRFFAAIWDPLSGGLAASDGLPIYESWRGALNWLYYLSEFLMLPVSLAYRAVDSLIPDSNWFPGIYSANISEQLNALAAMQPSVQQALQPALQNPVFQQTMVGYVDFLVIFAVLFFSLINPLVDHVYDFLKNLIWNLLIEFSFTKKKEAKYQEALEKRAADLMKLNVEYKNLSKEASALSTAVITDELTKVYNKRFFINKITTEFNTAKDKKGVLAIAMVDIDHFKKLNDNYGHLLGDKVLQAVAHVAKRGTPGGCFCCRFGGEEFSIIMPNKKPEEVLEIVGTIHRNLPLLRFEEDPNLRTAASFGVAIVDFKNPQAQELKSFEEFIKMADDELYRAKLNGRNRYEVNRTLYDGAS